MDRAIELQNKLVRQAALKPMVIWPQMTAYAVIVLGSSAAMAVMLSHIMKTIPLSGQPLYFVVGFASWVLIVYLARLFLITPVKRAQETRRLHLAAIAESGSRPIAQHDESYDAHPTTAAYNQTGDLP